MASNHCRSHVPAWPLDHLYMSQHRTPIKRISQGSLRALSRSANYPDAPHGLGFLTPALAELTEEMQTLQSHTQGLRNLENSLTRFNESFASWLYVQNMASLTLDWTQVRFFSIHSKHALDPPVPSTRLPSRHLFYLRNKGQVIRPHPPTSPSPLFTIPSPRTRSACGSSGSSSRSHPSVRSTPAERCDGAIRAGSGLDVDHPISPSSQHDCQSGKEGC